MSNSDGYEYKYSYGCCCAETRVAFDAYQAYMYGYPVLTFHITRLREMTSNPINTFRHLRNFPGPAFKGVVSPNSDTLYSSAWLDLR